jgi:hypothetical protein
MLTMTPSVRPAPADVCPELAARLGTDYTVVKAALFAGLIGPETLDLTRDPHRHTLYDFLSHCPEYVASDAQLDQLSAYHLWFTLRNASVASYLARQLAADDWTNGLPTNKHTNFPAMPGVKGLLPRVLRDVLEQILLQHDQPELAVAAMNGEWLDSTCWPAIEAALRSHSARRAAQARKARKGAPPKPKPIDPILLAIEKGDPYHFSRFQLEALDPKRLALVLPVWLEASDEIKAHLVRIPNLPDDIRTVAVQAYFVRKNDYPLMCFAEPFPTRLIPALSSPALSKLLLAHYRNVTSDGSKILDTPLDPVMRQDAFFTIALDQPDLVRWFEETDRLLAWQAALRKDVVQGWAQRPTDPEALWVLSILNNPDGITRPLALTLAKIYDRWPEERRRALAPSLVQLKWEPLTRYTAGD